MIAAEIAEKATDLQKYGAFAFGLVLGWYLYFLNRYRKEISLGDLTTVVGAIGGGAVLALVPAKSDLFGAYGIGLAVGFFTYFVFLVVMVMASKSFNLEWFLDGRRKGPDGTVGYGAEVRKPDAGPQKPVPMSFPLIRRYVDMPGQKLTAQILQTQGNDKDPRGTGGTCFGDSGGPNFIGDSNVIGGVTSYAKNLNCAGTGGVYRVDRADDLNWIGTFAP